MSSETTSKLPPLPPHPLVYGSMLDLVMDTPLVEVRRLGRDTPRARVFGKLESMNPGGSVKDRICLAMIEAAEREGRLKPGGVVIEPTSGNTGIGLAMVAAVKGYKLVLVMPESMSIERRRLMLAYGAKFDLTPKEGGMKGAIARAQELIEQTEGAWMPQQFDNPANVAAHAQSTAATTSLRATNEASRAPSRRLAAIPLT